MVGPPVVAEVKRTPLERRTPLRSKRPKGIPQDVRLALAERCLAQCELPDCTNLAQHPHHRLRRAQGGHDTLGNLLAVCFDCHRQIHDNPAWAYDQGYMIRSSDA